ncbi:MAG TPA: class I SAM-dependent methyltransferase [Nitrosopumilaceae archaeon]|nr:class I SAM-dependent methyltransferase [Nitrosopumilaceae archaeon]
MVYDTDYWNKYTDNNKSKNSLEFAKFIHDLATSLRVNKILEVGCNIGNDLQGFTENFEVNGLDLNEHALDIAKKSFPLFKFKNGTITEIPYEDSSMDFVFTHNVLNYINETEMEKAINELYRVSRKYILNCELFDEYESKIDNSGIASWKRNVYKRWLNFKVKIISDVDMHEDIESQKPRFTLVRKIS